MLQDRKKKRQKKKGYFSTLKSRVVSVFEERSKPVRKEIDEIELKSYQKVKKLPILGLGSKGNVKNPPTGNASPNVWRKPNPACNMVTSEKPIMPSHDSECIRVLNTWHLRIKDSTNE